jgi:hypothetical protein
MAEADLIVSATHGDVKTPDVLGWMPFMEAFLQVQRMQWELLVSWQRAAAAVQKELFDEWVCRFAGGVPIDA